MNDQSIIQAISVIVAAGLGGILTYLGSRSKREVEKLNEKLAKLRKKHRTACEQVQGYYKLEAAYCEEVAKLTGKAKETVKIEFRDRVENDDFPRPVWTFRDAANSMD
jgi:hypothetical protein